MSCYNCGSPHHYSDKCPKPKTNLSTCHTCKQSGHKMSACPQKKSMVNSNVSMINPTGNTSFGSISPVRGNSVITCHNCKKPGHKMNECPSINFVDHVLSVGNMVKCYNCNEIGHKSDKCPNPKKCYNCGKLGHTSPSCTEEKVNNNGLDEKLCIICMDKEKQYIALPCGHFQYCLDCVKQINNCSTCRGHIEKYTKVF